MACPSAPSNGVTRDLKSKNGIGKFICSAGSWRAIRVLRTQGNMHQQLCGRHGTAASLRLICSGYGHARSPGKPCATPKDDAARRHEKSSRLAAELKSFQAVPRHQQSLSCNVVFNCRSAHLFETQTKNLKSVLPIEASLRVKASPRKDGGQATHSYSL